MYSLANAAAPFYCCHPSLSTRTLALFLELEVQEEAIHCLQQNATHHPPQTTFNNKRTLEAST